MSECVLQDKSYKFALGIVKLNQYLNDEKHEFVLSKKKLDSGTALGVLVEKPDGEKIRRILRKNWRLPLKKRLRRIFGSGFYGTAVF